MTLYYKNNTTAITKVFYKNQQVQTMYHKNNKVYQLTNGVIVSKAQVHLGVIGDSTIAAGFGGLVVPAYIPAFTPITSVATAGDTILGQKTKYGNLTNTLDFDVVILQIGLNDMNVNQTTATVLSNYQALVNSVRASVSANCKIYVAKMLPCKQRFIDIYGATDGASAQQRWVDLNNAIMTSVTGVNGRIDSHVPLLDDGFGNLKAEYDTGDHIHENVAGRQVIADAWRDKLVLDGILTA